MNERMAGLETHEAEHLARYYRYYDAAAAGFWGHPAPYDSLMIVAPIKTSGDAGRIFVRNPDVRGPLSVFGYDYLRDKLGASRVDKLGLLQYQGLRGAGGDYAYEVLNLARYPLRVIDIRNTVSAIYGPVPTELVIEYILALRDAGIVRAR